MKKVIFLGPPGAGKGTVAKEIAKNFSLVHISTGDIIRDSIKNQTELGKKVKEIVESGGLVSDDLTLALVKERLSKEDVKNGYILDGFPRTLVQAKAFLEMDKVDFAVYFEISNEEIVKRLGGRRVHKDSGRTYHVIYNPPKVEGKDDITGEDLIIRADDQKEAILKRLSVYEELTAPLVKFYKESHIEFKEVDATLPMDKAYSIVEKFFK